MIWPQLHRTLTDLVQALEPDENSGLHIDLAELSVPLELTTAVVDGALVVHARVPHSRWKAGFLPRTSTATLRVEAVAPAAAAVAVATAASPIRGGAG
jgi:hypothetical protein